MSRVGIRDVAARSGFSVTTVSHALSGKGRLPEETRDRVRKVAEELGYRPSAAARNLAGGKTGLLGLVVSQPSGGRNIVSDFAYFAHVMTAAAVAALDRGYALVLAPESLSPVNQGGLAVDGLIVVDPIQGEPLIAEAARNGVPLVTTGRIVGDFDEGAWVDNDHVAAVRSVLDHLARRGAQRTALITSPTVISYTVDIERGYRDWCAEHGAEPLMVASDSALDERAGYAAASSLLDLPTPPDAVFAAYDRLAFGTLLAAEARGVRVPQDLMVAMTATKSSAGQSAGPAVTSLDLHPELLGRHAAELLIDIIEHRADTAHIIVRTRLTARASTRRRSARKRTSVGSDS